MTPHLADTPVLETARLTLRAPARRDWPHWHAFAQSDRAHHIGGPYDERHAWRAFCHIVGMWVARGYGSFVITLRDGDGAALGMTGPWHPATWPERELGWSIWDAGAEGQGIAHEAAAAARDFAFQNLGWTTAVSYIDAPNVRSIRLAERLGAVRDPDARAPDFDDDDLEVLVYRHPGPGGPA